MAAINFPDSPTLNQQVTLGGFLWEWNGEVWRKINAGKSAYAIAVDNGFTGTEVQWLASLQGEDGVAGATGATGATGPQGPAGAPTRTIRSVSSSTTLQSGDLNQMVRFTGTSAQVLTVNDVLTPGTSVEVLQDNSGSVEFQSGSGVTLLSSLGEFATRGQNSVVILRCVASGQYRLTGDLGGVLPAQNAMVAWYTFQDSTNDLATGDGYGNGTAFNLTSTNVSYVTNGFTTGIKSLQVTNSPASVVQNTSMPWSGNPQFSVSMWVKREEDVRDGIWGIGGGNTANGVNAYGLSFSPVNDIGWDLWASQRFSTNQIYPLNQWIHVTWIKYGAMDQTGLKCVINGVEYGVVPEGGGPTQTPSLTNGFSLGDITANETRPITTMEFYDVRVFNRALTTEEAQLIYTSTVA